eukprot:4769176-Pleurochrysis_carterae.AAC.2
MGRSTGPEKRRRMRLPERGAPGAGTVTATSGRRCCPSSALGLATRGASRWDGKLSEWLEGAMEKGSLQNTRRRC